MTALKRSIGRGIGYALSGQWKFAKAVWYFSTAFLGLVGAIRTVLAMAGVDTNPHPATYVVIAIAVLTHLWFQRNRMDSAPVPVPVREGVNIVGGSLDAEGVRTKNLGVAVRARNSKVKVRDMEIE